MRPLLFADSLTFAYPRGKAFSFPDFELTSGQHMLILGESGIGKSTLLHLLAGLLKPQNGIIRVSGTDITLLPSVKLDKFRGRNIGMIFQRPYFVNALTVWENLALVQRISGNALNPQSIEFYLNYLGIAHLGNQKPKQMSLGEQKRAAIALAVVNKPKLILADEPTASLDDKNSQRVVHLLKELADVNESVLLIATHDRRLTSSFHHSLKL